MNSQTKRLKEALEAGHIIDPLKAWKELGIYNFSARLSELRKDLPGLVGDWIEVTNQFGETTRVKAYRINGIEVAA
jgi:hypothetical protein